MRRWPPGRRTARSARPRAVTFFFAIPYLSRDHRGAAYSHKNIEQWLNLEHNVMLVGTTLLGAGIVLFIERDPRPGTGGKTSRLVDVGLFHAAVCFRWHAPLRGRH